MMTHHRSIHEGISYHEDASIDIKGVGIKNEEEDENISHNWVNKSQTQSKESTDAKSTKCQECGKVFSTKTYMEIHYRSMHKGIKYPCKHCDVITTSKSSLRRHIQSIHEGIRYPCMHCGYQAKDKVYLKKHIQTVHQESK